MLGLRGCYSHHLVRVNVANANQTGALGHLRLDRWVRFQPALFQVGGLRHDPVLPLTERGEMEALILWQPQFEVALDFVGERRRPVGDNKLIGVHQKVLRRPAGAQ